MFLLGQLRKSSVKLKHPLLHQSFLKLQRLQSLDQRSQILVADDLGNIAGFIEHLDFSAAVTGTLACIG
jgi:hypothetical protein